jgi:phage FluMu protein Com
MQKLSFGVEQRERERWGILPLVGGVSQRYFSISAGVLVRWERVCNYLFFLTRALSHLEKKCSKCIFYIAIEHSARDTAAHILFIKSGNSARVGDWRHIAEFRYCKYNLGAIC